MGSTRTDAADANPKVPIPFRQAISAKFFQISQRVIPGPEIIRRFFPPNSKGFGSPTCRTGRNGVVAIQ
jgi:hypothetical protein